MSLAGADTPLQTISAGIGHQLRLLNSKRDTGFRLILVGVTLLAFGLRVYRLQAKSLWLDEGLSITFASRGLRDLIRTLVTQDIHPPAHYLFLHWWMQIAGHGEFAARFIALIAGVLLIPLVYALASAVFAVESPSGQSEKTLATRMTALVGAVLIAVSPFLIYYSQEARMYGELASWTVLSSLLFWWGVRAWTARHPDDATTTGRASRGRSRRWLLAGGYAVVTAMSIYTHYFSALVIAFQALFVAIVAIRQRGVLLYWVPAGITALVLYAPWMVGAYWQIRRLLTVPDFWQGELSLTFIVEKVFTAFAVGKSGAALQSLPLLALAVLVFAGGLLLLVRTGLAGRRGDVFCVLYLLIPLFLLYAISARNPKFTERYLIMIAPIFYLIVARAIVALGGLGWRLRRAGDVGRWAIAGAVSIAVVAMITSSSLEIRRVYFGPGYEKDDNRSAARYIQAHEEPGDVIILMMDSSYVFDQYYHGASPIRGLHPGDNMPYAADSLNRDLAGHRRMWLLMWQENWADPSGVVRESIDAKLTRLEAPDSFQGLKLRLYSLDGMTPFSAQPNPINKASVSFGGLIQLDGWDPPAKPATSNGTTDVTLYWHALQPLREDYIASVRFKSGDYRWARQDQRPAAYTYPTNVWKVGKVVWGRIPVVIPPGTPPGEYDLEVVVYSQETHRDLSVIDSAGRAGEPFAVVGKIRIGKAIGPIDPASLKMQMRLSLQTGNGVTLLGTTVDTPTARPGARIDLALYWQATDMPRDFEEAIALRDSAGKEWPLESGIPLATSYPPSRWSPGEAIAERHSLVVPAEASPGDATVLMRIGDSSPASGTDQAPVSIGTVQIGQRPRVGQPPSDVQHQLDYRLGDTARLIGYDLSTSQPAPGSDVRLTLYWQSLGSTTTSYTVFAHLLDKSSQVVAQQDNAPGGGSDPTSSWLPDEYAKDEYTLSIKSDTTAGSYEIEVGMYDPATGKRLDVFDATGTKIGDRIVLGTIDVN